MNQKAWRVANSAVYRGKYNLAKRIAAKHFGFTDRQARAFGLFLRTIYTPTAWRLQRAYRATLGCYGFRRNVDTEYWPEPMETYYFGRDVEHWKGSSDAYGQASSSWTPGPAPGHDSIRRIRIREKDLHERKRSNA